MAMRSKEDKLTLRFMAALIAFVAVLLTHSQMAWAGDASLAANRGLAWLVNQRDLTDGSWGITDDVKFVQTSEAVSALAAHSQLSPAYYAGISWLANHSSTNVDFLSRRILALGLASASVSSDIQLLRNAQGLTGTGNNGWGLSGNYLGSPFDTSLSLQALNQQGISANVPSALSFLTASQLSSGDAGWALGQETISDPITTAQVIQALVPWSANNAIVSTAISKGLTALNSKVTATSPVPQIALAAVANLRVNSTSSNAATLINALIAQQAADGSWGGDPYATSLALRALAASLSRDIAAQKIAVSVPDANLRAAINNALGQGALDAISRGQLTAITTLDISGRGIKSLSGLEWVPNLTTLYAANNSITSTAPLASLGLLTSVDFTGNPVSRVASTIQLGSNQRMAVKTAPTNLTATIYGNRPIGTVTFYDGSNVIGAVTLNASSSGVTSANSKYVLTTTLAGGFRKLKAAYSGDAQNTAVTSNVINQPVNPEASGILAMILN